MASTTDYNAAVFELDKALQRLKLLKDLTDAEKDELLAILGRMESALWQK